MISKNQINQIASMLTEDPDIVNEVRTLSKGSWGATASGKGRACPSCNAPVDPGEKQCESCGNMINWTGSQRKGYEAQTLRCPNCGAGWEQGERVCKSCGKAGRPESVGG